MFRAMFSPILRSNLTVYTTLVQCTDRSVIFMTLVRFEVIGQLNDSAPVGLENSPSSHYITGTLGHIYILQKFTNSCLRRQ
jgi:hypothetical protein